MSEIPGLHEGVEAVHVMFQGTEMFIKLAGSFANWTIEKLAKLAALLYHHMQKKKSEMKEGEVNFKDLVTKNKSGINIMQIEYEHLDEFLKFAKEMGVSYSIMPDINKQDEYLEIAFPEYQGEAFRYFISQHPDYSKTYTYGEYFDNANPTDMAEELKGLEKEVMQYITSIKEKEQNNIKDDFAKDSEKENIINDTEIKSEDNIRINIDTSLLFRSKEKNQIMAAVPNTEDEYIHINKKDLTKDDDKFYISLKPGMAYMITKKDETPVLDGELEKMITGEEYLSAVNNISLNNEINKNKKDKLKGTVKLVRKDENGKFEEKLVSGKSSDKNLTELIDRFEAKKAR